MHDTHAILPLISIPGDVILQFQCSGGKKKKASVCTFLLWKSSDFQRSYFLFPPVLVKDTLAAIVEEPTAGDKKANFKTCRKSDVKNEDPADMAAGKINGNGRRSLRAV